MKADNSSSLYCETYVLALPKSVGYDYGCYAYANDVPVMRENGKPILFPACPTIFEYFDKLDNLPTEVSKQKIARTVWVVMHQSTIYKIINPFDIAKDGKVTYTGNTLYTHTKQISPEVEKAINTAIKKMIPNNIQNLRVKVK